MGCRRRLGGLDFFPNAISPQDRKLVRACRSQDLGSAARRQWKAACRDYALVGNGVVGRLFECLKILPMLSLQPSRAAVHPHSGLAPGQRLNGLVAQETNDRSKIKVAALQK